MFYHHCPNKISSVSELEYNNPAVNDTPKENLVPHLRVHILTGGDKIDPLYTCTYSYKTLLGETIQKLN